MTQSLTRVPVVGALGYKERLRSLPASFTATLAVEPDNRYFLNAVAVLVSGEKVGYIAPEHAASVYDAVKASPSPLTCPARRGSASDHATSGVEILVDLSALSLAAIE